MVDILDQMEAWRKDARLRSEQDFYSRMMLEIRNDRAEIKRLREALQEIYWTTKEPEIDRIAGAALQQDVSQMTRMHDSHAQMSDDKGQR